MKILIAEDDLISRRLLTAILSQWGHDPIAVSDGNAAWEVLQDPSAPKLALLDWEMPELSGLDVCRRARQMETSDPPYIIILTAKGEKGDLVQGLEAGANDYVVKPYDRDELRARIRAAQRMVELQSELNKTRDALAFEAFHDPLTGILNRRAIFDTLAKELSRAGREARGLSIGLCDIDHFKKVNDTYGHQVGDEVLRQFAQRIRASLRDYDHVGRYGGEEFLVVAPGSTGGVEEGLYERLAQAAADGMRTKAGEISITVSIGVAGGSGGSPLEGLLAEADIALYRAKREGRNRVAYADREAAGN